MGGDDEVSLYAQPTPPLRWPLPRTARGDEGASQLSLSDLLLLSNEYL